MAFQIVTIAPSYCPSTDAAIGSEVTARSHAYETAALALHLARRQAELDELFGGELSFVVVPFGASAFDYRKRITGADLDAAPAAFDPEAF